MHELPQHASKAIIAEAFRILRPGGTFAIMVGNVPPIEHPFAGKAAAPRRVMVPGFHAGDEPGITWLPEGVQEPLRLRCLQEHRALAHGIYGSRLARGFERGWLQPSPTGG